VRFSPDGSLLASADHNSSRDISKVKLWQVSDGRLLRSFDINFFSDPHSLAFSPDGSLLAAPAKERGVNLLRVADFTLLRTVLGDVSVREMVAFSRDGSLLLLMGVPEPGLYRVSDGTLARRLKPTDYVTSQAISRDGSYVAAGGAEGWIDVWRASDGAQVRTIKAAKNAEFVWGLDFSPDGRFIASVSSDEAVRLWRIA